ncbi:MAG: deoxyguanosinetriphosphate triphosphohydrolase [Sulfurovaceae bacterium]|nr:deoxyguanosinetriphosphate triphosphohydrolase [Sulfurovaceae bacterium]MDD5548195.1 deoxyguanosinetriphosphate triphosphohydrolase [Sulfurovaceae bacterium]
MRADSRFYAFKEDFRDPFARDRDRIIHSSSFRRLEYKTQVFLNHEGDYFRTRLTHSLEVSQIARTLAKTLGLKESLCEAIALAHDLGHTPFGHIGGDTLDELLKNSGSKFGFDHNFQSFRVLTKLEKRYQEFDGLNLTFGTLEGVLKHSTPYKKNFLINIDSIFHLDKHPSIEAMIVDRADEIAYISADIDDGIKYGLIDIDNLLCEPLGRRIDELTKKDGLNSKDRLYRHRFVANLITFLVENFIGYSRKNVEQINKSEPLCSYFSSSETIPVGFEKNIETEIKMLKKYLFDNLYRHEKIAKKMYSGKQCIKGLFIAFTEDINLLPKKERELLSQKTKNRVIADYIASMTDRYAIGQYHELYGI